MILNGPAAFNTWKYKISTFFFPSAVLPGGRGLSAEDLQGVSELGGLRGLEGRSAGAGSMHSAERRLSAHGRERAQ